MHTSRRDGVASTKQCRRDISSDGIRNLATASERGRLKEDLESSTCTLAFLSPIFSLYYLFCNPFSTTFTGDVNPIRTRGDYSKPSHEGYRNTIELPIGNNVVHLRSDTIRIYHHMGGSYYSFPCSILSTGRTVKLCNDILMFQQHQGESLSEAWTRFKDLLQKVPHHGIDLWLQVQIFYDHVTPATRRTIHQSAGVQRLIEAHLAPMQPTQVNKITSSCKICSGPHDTQYCMKNPKQAFVEYASSRTDEARGLVSNFMASQAARVSKFEADFKQQQSKMTNKIDMVLKAITDRIARALPSDTVKNSKLNVNSASTVLSAQEEPENSNATERKEEQRDTPQLELKDPTDIEKLGPNKNDTEREVEWLDVEEPLDLVEIRLRRDMHVFVGNMGYVMDFTILENIKTNIDPGLSHITFKTPYKDPERSELSSEGHDLLSSRIILSEDDNDRGCRKPSDLEDGFYRDTIKLRPEYVTGMDDEGEVTLYLIRKSLEIPRKIHWMTLGGRFNQLSHVSSPLLSKPGEY
ncbi:hypothetical protein Tco_1449855 [Tanacetum coccineum]